MFTYRTVDVIADTPLHKKLSLLQSGNQYEKGKQDFSEKVILKHFFDFTSFFVVNINTVVFRYKRSK